MKWDRLSDHTHALIAQLRSTCSNERAVHCLEQLDGLDQLAIIPHLIGPTKHRDRTVSTLAASLLARLVRGIPTNLFPTLDDRIRSEYIYGSAPWVREDIDLLDFKDDTPAVLGVASCVHDGHVREAAVRRLDREIIDGQELPFLLIRLGDWVPQVRNPAERAIRRRLTEHHRAAYLRNLPILVRMQNRSRTHESVLFAQIKQWLLQDVTSLVRHALASTDRMTRREGPLWAWATLGAENEAQQRDIVDLMLQSDDPASRLRVALWAAGGMMAARLAGDVLPKLLSDRFATVRRMSLAWCATRDPEKHLPTLRAALLDPSAVMRSVAQFHLPHLQGLDLRAFYREAIQCPDLDSVPPGAIGGLGEVGRSEDAALVSPLVAANKIAVRKAAIRALARLAPEEHMEIFVTSLRDASPGVSREARDALEAYASLVGSDRLTRIFEEADHRHIRRQALALIAHLPKWQSVSFLIEFCLHPDGDIQSAARNHLASWVRGFNRSHFSNPSESELIRLRRALDRSGAKLPGSLNSELFGLVASLR